MRGAAVESAMPENSPVSKRRPEPPSATQVYAVVGVDPEVQAYAMAKYSRSALSLKDSLRQLNEQRAEEFLNTFYFQYGHRSIADLAHVAMAIERLSLLAAIAVVDEQRWDGQERSTRYQDFKKSGYYVPALPSDPEIEAVYRRSADFLFAEYQAFSAEMFRYLAERTACPADMPREQYERTLRARAFDIARYLLPLATNTSLGQIVNARTLENQVARLLSHTHGEVRQVGELLKRAAREPAYNLKSDTLAMFMEELQRRDEGLARQASEHLLKEVRVAPTLVKYANPNPYEIETRRDLRQAAAQVMGGAKVSPAQPVELLEPEALEIELATTLLYEHTKYPYRQIRERVEGLSSAERDNIV
jgi:thymidylate synthase ThyX